MIGVIAFYIFILLGILMMICGIIAVDYFLLPIGLFIIISAFLFKHEFKLPVLFWIKDD